MKSDVSVGAGRLRLTRIFNAPRALVFSWWTQAEKLQQWSGCKEATRCEIRMDFRKGGGFTQKMHIAGAGEFSFTGTYDEIVEPERIAYHAQMGPTLMSIVLEFFDEGKQTRVVLTQEGFPDEISCKTVTQGTTESFDKFAALLDS